MCSAALDARLSTHGEVAGVGASRPDQSDPPSRSIRSRKYRGRLRAPLSEGVRPPHLHRPGFADGAGCPFGGSSERRLTRSRRRSACDQFDRSHRPHADPPRDGRRPSIVAAEQFAEPHPEPYPEPHPEPYPVSSRLSKGTPSQTPPSQRTENPHSPSWQTHAPRSSPSRTTPALHSSARPRRSAALRCTAPVDR